jgi:hypothetical protein
MDNGAAPSIVIPWWIMSDVPPLKTWPDESACFHNEASVLSTSTAGNAVSHGHSDPCNQCVIPLQDIGAVPSIVSNDVFHTMSDDPPLKTWPDASACSEDEASVLSSSTAGNAVSHGHSDPCNHNDTPWMDDGAAPSIVIPWWIMSDVHPLKTCADVSACSNNEELVQSTSSVGNAVSHGHSDPCNHYVIPLQDIGAVPSIVSKEVFHTMSDVDPLKTCSDVSACSDNEVTVQSATQAGKAVSHGHSDPCNKKLADAITTKDIAHCLQCSKASYLAWHDTLEVRHYTWYGKW